MTSKQRAYLKSLAMKMDAIIQLGKGGLTPENTKAVDEALAARELIKISVLQNCLEDPKEMAQILAERTHSQVIHRRQSITGLENADQIRRYKPKTGCQQLIRNIASEFFIQIVFHLYSDDLFISGIIHLNSENIF